MESVDVFTWVYLLIGLLLIIMTLAQSYVARLPLSTAVVYLIVGIAIGPWGLGLLQLDPIKQASLIERITEVAVLISLFVAGLKFGIPVRDKRWRIPIQLATISMVLTVASIALVAFYGMGMSIGAAVLLGAILAPTDPVLASDVQLADAGDRDRLRFGLTGEGGLNDGAAFPFVMLGLGLLSLHDLGSGAWRWWTIDVLWAIGGGLGIGAVIGASVGRLVIYLRVRHREALGSDEFLALGLLALAYGAALLCHTYGFLAVFAAGLAMRRTESVATAGISKTHPAEVAVGDSDPKTEEAPSMMMNAVQRFNAQIERFAEVGVVIIVGSLVVVVPFRSDVLWFVPLLFFVIRPLVVLIGLIGTQLGAAQRGLIAWFGIRGVGSVYYLTYAISHGVDEGTAGQLLPITIYVVVASVAAHGVSVTPLMRWYESRGKGGR